MNGLFLYVAVWGNSFVAGVGGFDGLIIGENKQNEPIKSDWEPVERFYGRFCFLS